MYTNPLNKKLSKSIFRGILNKSIHSFTKGKTTEDIIKAIDILKEKTEYLENILKNKNKIRNIDGNL